MTRLRTMTRDSPGDLPVAEADDDTDDWVSEPGCEPPAVVRSLADLDLLSELTHPTRSHILRALKQPRTVAEVAELLDVPVTRLYHHINRLESLGFIQVVATRRVAAVTERRYQVTARSWQIDRELFETSDRRELAIALGSVFDVAKLAFQREVESGGYENVPDPDTHSYLYRGQVVLSTERRVELLKRLNVLFDEFASDVDESDPDANRMEILAAVFPETS
jgi:DNA-binding MarR family transcriptional regulator